MRRPFLFAFIAVAMASRAAAAQEAAMSGRCTTPDSVVFRGATRVSPATMRVDVGLPPAGTALGYRDVQRAIKNLFATGQFSDVQAACEPSAAGDRATLVFTVRERPVLQGVDVAGTDKVSGGTVRERIELLVGRPLDPALVARALQRIDSLYESRGFYLAEVRPESTTVAEGVKLTFRVNEGRRLAVSGVRVAGNAALPDKTVVKAMQTRPEGFLWWKRGEFDDDKYAGDIAERIPQLYMSRGFIDVQVLRDTVIIDRERGKALIEVTVEEGKQYRVGSFEVAGASRFNREDIARFYPFGEQGRTLSQTVMGLVRRDRGPRDVFDQSQWDAATGRVQEAYADEGYVYAQVRPVVERIVDGDSLPRVNLRWEIEERSPAIINRVEIVGNDITVESCIRDMLLTVPGDVFRRNLLIASFQRVGNLGFFETPLAPPETRQVGEKGDLDIIFRVKEKRTGTVNFGASVGQGTGVGGFVGFEQPNLFGKCKRGSLQWQFGTRINDFNLSYTDPAINESRISATVNAYHTRSRFQVQDLGRIIRTGGQLQIGVPIPGSQYTRAFVSYGGEGVRYGEGGLTSQIQCDNCFRSTVGTTLTRDTRFDMPFPSSGTLQTVAAQFNGGPLGGTAAFQKYTGELHAFSTIAQFGGGRPGSQPIKLVFGLSTRAGAIFGSTGPFFVSQAFSLGGVQYGEPLRGYEEFSITPAGVLPTTDLQARPESFGNAFLTNTAQLGLRFNQQLYLHAFYDAGNIWSRAREFDPTRLFRGAGVGASLVTPLGPLGLDVGYGFDRVDDSGRRAPKWQMHFKLGQIF
jgi:outer membrane protein insertion porin family